MFDRLIHIIPTSTEDSILYHILCKATVITAVSSLHRRRKAVSLRLITKAIIKSPSKPDYHLIWHENGTLSSVSAFPTTRRKPLTRVLNDIIPHPQNILVASIAPHNVDDWEDISKFDSSKTDCLVAPKIGSNQVILRCLLNDIFSHSQSIFVGGIAPYNVHDWEDISKFNIFKIDCLLALKIG
ncbi:hypothetical protein FF38_06692 [Lucilia cuprina]|uniref:Uncharacterized protein n=1 Tax=Lucilia cuprina TaxID=7375 RepID=A0A0L0C1D9_LUCCU|nr:hypothetical protein FF38_06692 [Lucilia cuprina]